MEYYTLQISENENIVEVVEWCNENISYVNMHLLHLVKDFKWFLYNNGWFFSVSKREFYIKDRDIAMRLLLSFNLQNKWVIQLE